jgi:hypothetical protein
MIAIVFAGILILKKINIQRVIGGAISASVLFFIISNFGVWLTSPAYDISFQGFIACYTMAIPFFHMSVVGDLFYCGVLFGLFEFAKYKVPQLQTA